KPSALVMEVSSHSLQLDRVAGLQFDVCIFTNLTQDHLDFHATMENYYQAKKKLFSDHRKPGGFLVVNIDDPYGRRLAAEIGAQGLVTYGTSADARVRIVRWSSAWEGSELQIFYNQKTLNLTTTLCGAFNIYNITALCAAASALGVEAGTLVDIVKQARPPVGRLERVPITAPFTVLVDYAHTPDALENVLAAARPLTKGKLICVFGCGGDRDKTKRPLMAAAVARTCDRAIITSDNPRGEDPEGIIAAIAAGMPRDFTYATIADRGAAIAAGLALAQPGDCLVVAGKGHEDYQEVRGVKRHFNDREMVLELFAARKSGEC
ncbi:MAG: UDP-N-acetylmuramoyl-L-alanyl-D-glutamate--2,6-diaminopimelate ligase, partial [Chitinivibrionales bacterium]|nr:UDP-N-acetylmuramoyl-L-alanyl-D-glutamate--2,6-diaminopimelate ligase [Chitinivibrionales bacterium]